MRKLSFFLALMLFAAVPASAKHFRMVKYKPMSQEECMARKDELGLKYCPYDNDHLAGAVAACGGVWNMPTVRALLSVATQLYNGLEREFDDEFDGGWVTTLYGERDDAKMKELGIWVNDSRIYYWSNEEAKDGKGGYVRMVATEGSNSYYVPRDGSRYVTHVLGEVNYGKTKNVRTGNPRHDSNLSGLPNKDALVTICIKRKK